MTTADEKMREDVSLLRKYAYEFALTYDLETHTMMLEVQKRIINNSAQYSERIKELEQQKEQLQAQGVGLVDALTYVDAYLDNVPHGDNCFVSNHYEGDPGNRCNCGKDGVCQSVDHILSATTQTEEAYKRRIQAEALEEAADYFNSDEVDAWEIAEELRRMAAELKGE